jgi:transposase InsO family protein
MHCCFIDTQAAPPDRAYDGIIWTVQPNARWTSDGFQIPCSDQAVHVPFCLDACDREVITWCAGTGSISGEMIRDLMLQTVEHRFQ